MSSRRGSRIDRTARRRPDRIDETGGSVVAHAAEMTLARLADDGELRDRPVVPHFMRMDEVPMRAVDWLWRNYLPAGMLALLAGEQGTGKSTLAALIAAILSRGGYWPDGEHVEPAVVMWWSGEEPLRSVIAPRLLAHGAEMSRIWWLGEDYDPGNTLHVAEAAGFAKRVGVKLLVLDPIIFAGSGAADSHNALDIRQSLKKWVEFADETGACLLGITHLNKGSQDRPILDRVSGSGAWTQIARVVLFASPTEGSTDRVLLRAKNNVGPAGGGWRYKVEGARLPNPDHAEDPAQDAEIRTQVATWGPAIEGGADALVRELTAPPRKGALGDEERIARVLEYLRANPDERPTKRTMRTLIGGNGIEADRILRGMEEDGLVEVERGAAHIYRLPGTGGVSRV